MKKLLKLQIRNIFQNKVFYVCTILTLVLSVVFSYIATLVSKNVNAPTVLPEIVGQFTTGVDILGMIFITIFTTFDFQEGTTKNIVGRGFSKIKLLFSKLIASFIGIMALDLIVSAVIFVLYIKNGLGYNSGLFIQLGYGLIKTIAFTVMYGVIAFSLEKTSSSIIANMFAPNIISLILVTADTNLKVDMSKYWIENVGNTFLDNPTINNLLFPVIMYIVYTLLFCYIGSRIANNKEIK